MISIRIPQDRIGVLIGKNGETRSQIEKISGVKLEIDSETGDVNLVDNNPKDPEMPLKVREVVRAIGRGFSPERAFRLFDTGVYLEIIDLKDYTGKNSKRVKTVRSRLIGTRGKTRRLIEELSESYVSIYGNTVSIIGDYIQMEISRESIMMILRGNQHGTVYKYLERKRKDIRLAKLDSV
ncbi:MAG: KH domain-containing protein [Thermoplasmata archaeon]